MKRKIIPAILLAVLLACGVLSAGSFAEEPVLFQYEVQEDGTASITGISNKEIETLEIPAELDG